MVRITLRLRARKTILHFEVHSGKSFGTRNFESSPVMTTRFSKVFFFLKSRKIPKSEIPNFELAFFKFSSFFPSVHLAYLILYYHLSLEL